MTLEEAARELGVSSGTLRNQVHNGKLRAEKLGSRFWVVRPAEVERYRTKYLGKQTGGRPPKSDEKR